MQVVAEKKERKKSKLKKRQATSPLLENGLSYVNTSEHDINNRIQRKGLSKKKDRQEYNCGNTKSVSGFTYDNTYLNMTFQQQTPFGQMSQPSYAHSSPPAPAQFSSNAFGL